MRTKDEIREAFAFRAMLDQYRAFFLVGIGGAGMSALARILHERGFVVSGSDSTPSPATSALESEGIRVHIGHSERWIEDSRAIVLSDAIDLKTNPEVRRARELGLSLFRRSQLLGWLLRDRKVIAITGTHGKTSTTGLLGAALMKAGLDPFVVVGAYIPEFGSPIVVGNGPYAVVEACEAYDSLHDLDPHIVLLTNLELDHVDFHGSYENLRDSVIRFVDRIPKDGCLVYCEEDAGAREVADHAKVQTIAYSQNDWSGPLALPGVHNRLNAAGAMVVAKHITDRVEDAKKGISEFTGAERRLQTVRSGPITVVDDYAHTPSEVRASLAALREAHPDHRLIVVYQPHLYSRTDGQYEAFADALSLANEIYITDIYPAREPPMPGVSSARIAELTRVTTTYVPSRHLLPRKVAQRVKPGDLVCGMGAGNISEFVPAFIEELDRKGATKVAVVYGGDSAEREVSLHSGRCVFEALQRKGYDAKLYDVSDMLLSSGDLKEFTGSQRPDVAFLALHGTRSEDGATQGLFELLHIPYTGSKIGSSALAMDKALAKKVFEQAGLQVPKGQLLRSPSDPISIKALAIVKPNAQGSTVGLSFVENDADLVPAVEKAFRYDSAVLVEEWIVGMETSVPVLGDRALLPVEIAPKNGRYDFASKYVPGATEEIIPARLPEAMLKRLQEAAIVAHQALGCEGASRTDIMVRDDELIVLEVNTLPGMTKTSLLPNSANASGLSYDDLVDWIVQDAIRRYAKTT